MDEDVNVRDAMLVENTPIDYLDFASPASSLGSKMGLDAMNKWSAETQRAWGTSITVTPEVTAQMDALWQTPDLRVKLGSSPRGICASSYQLRSVLPVRFWDGLGLLRGLRVRGFTALKVLRFPIISIFAGLALLISAV